jgi:hypothetical protein
LSPASICRHKAETLCFKAAEWLIGR